MGELCKLYLKIVIVNAEIKMELQYKNLKKRKNSKAIINYDNYKRNEVYKLFVRSLILKFKCKRICVRA